MNTKQTLEQFKQLKKNKDFVGAAAMMRLWAAGQSEKPGDLWLAEMALLLMAIGLDLYQEAAVCIEALQALDSSYPDLLSLMALVEARQGRLGQAIVYAEQAAANAKQSNDLNADLYANDLAALLRQQSADTERLPLPR